MALYSLAFTPPGIGLTSLGAVAPVWDAMAAATNKSAIVEVSVAITATLGAQPVLFLGRSANTPVQLGPTAPLPEDPNDRPSVTGIATAWSTAPTAPTNALRRTFLGTAVGGGVIWSFPRGLAIASSTSVGVFASAAANQNLFLQCHAVVNE